MLIILREIFMSLFEGVHSLIPSMVLKIPSGYSRVFCQTPGSQGLVSEIVHCVRNPQKVMVRESQRPERVEILRKSLVRECMV